MCSARPDIKKKELKAFLYVSNYEKASLLRYVIEDLKDYIDTQILLRLDSFVMVPREAINGLNIEEAQLQAERYTF